MAFTMVIVLYNLRFFFFYTLGSAGPLLYKRKRDFALGFPTLLSFTTLFENLASIRFFFVVICFTCVKCGSTCCWNGRGATSVAPSRIAEVAASLPWLRASMWGSKTIFLILFPFLLSPPSTRKSREQKKKAKKQTKATAEGSQMLLSSHLFPRPCGKGRGADLNWRLHHVNSGNKPRHTLINRDHYGKKKKKEKLIEKLTHL